MSDADRINNLPAYNWWYDQTTEIWPGKIRVRNWMLDRILASFYCAIVLGLLFVPPEFARAALSANRPAEAHARWFALQRVLAITAILFVALAPHAWFWIEGYRMEKGMQKINLDVKLRAEARAYFRLMVDLGRAFWAGLISVFAASWLTQLS